MLRGPIETDYQARWARKHTAYQASGILDWSVETPDGRLIVTKDGRGEGLDSASLHRMASQLWSTL